MSQVIQAVFENGVLRPTQPVNLPDNCQVEIEVRAVGTATGVQPDWNEFYAILGKPVATGEIDLAARHSEHQP